MHIFSKRLKLRVKKFGAQTENLKKDMRAERFGNEESKLAKRAQRFGGSVGDTPEKDVLEKRAKRFGETTATKVPTHCPGIGR